MKRERPNKNSPENYDQISKQINAINMNCIEAQIQQITQKITSTQEDIKTIEYMANRIKASSQKYSQHMSCAHKDATKILRMATDIQMCENAKLPNDHHKLLKLASRQEILQKKIKIIEKCHEIEEDSYAHIMSSMKELYHKLHPHKAIEQHSVINADNYDKALLNIILSNYIGLQNSINNHCCIEKDAIIVKNFTSYNYDYKIYDVICNRIRLFSGSTLYFNSISISIDAMLAAAKPGILLIKLQDCQISSIDSLVIFTLNSQVPEVVFSRCIFKLENPEDMFQLIKCNSPYLKSITYHDCSINDDLVPFLYSSLSQNTVLTKIDLSDNLISKDAMPILKCNSRDYHCAKECLLRGNPCCDNST